jgi:DNA-binding HxlR family transcriptional regulator
MIQSVNIAAGGCGCDGSDATATAQCCCVVRELTHAIGRKHALAILNRIGGSPPARFTDLQRGLEIGPSTLADTLQELEQVGLIVRSVLGESPPRSEYHLTPAGEALRARLRPFLETVRRVT